MLIDAGSSLHRQLELIVRAGMSPADAVCAATGDAAEALRRTGELGTIRQGSRADLVLIDRDPAQEIAAIRRLRKVLKDGRRVA